jgi:perosamine synthetase
LKYPVFEPDFGEAEIAAVTSAMRRGEISGVFGKSISQFEEAFASYCGVGHGVAVSNGTVALQLAARVAGVGPGDEVLVSACTNIASALAVFYNGAITIPVDACPRTWNLDLGLLERLITPRTKAIIAVHFLGNPVDMPRLMEIAERHGLKVIEDCAEAHGAEWQGRKVGSFGHLACFSFLSNKVITTGEGGMILTRDAGMAEQLRYLRSLAFGKIRFYHEEAGYNFRLTSMQAAMGVVQVGRLEEIIGKKIDLYRRYQKRLASIRGIRLVQEPTDGRHVHWMVGLRLDREFGISRDDLRNRLTAHGVDTRTFFCPMNQQPFLNRQPGSRRASCPIADDLWKDGLYLPSTTSLSDVDLDFIVGAIRGSGGI